MTGGKTIMPMQPTVNCVIRSQTVFLTSQATSSFVPQMPDGLGLTKPEDILNVLRLCPKGRAWPAISLCLGVTG